MVSIVLIHMDYFGGVTLCISCRVVHKRVESEATTHYTVVKGEVKGRPELLVVAREDFFPLLFFAYQGHSQPSAGIAAAILPPDTNAFAMQCGSIAAAELPQPSFNALPPRSLVESCG